MCDCWQKMANALQSLHVCVFQIIKVTQEKIFYYKCAELALTNELEMHSLCSVVWLSTVCILSTNFLEYNIYYSNPRSLSCLGCVKIFFLSCLFQFSCHCVLCTVPMFEPHLIGSQKHSLGQLQQGRIGY